MADLAEVVLVLPDKPAKALVSKNDHVVEQIPPGAAHESLSGSAHVWGSYRCVDHPCTNTCSHAVEGWSGLVVAMAHQDPGVIGPPWLHFAATPEDVDRVAKGGGLQDEVTARAAAQIRCDWEGASPERKKAPAPLRAPRLLSVDQLIS